MNISYLRNSRLIQGSSLETQKKLITDFCKTHDIKLDKIIVDEGISGSGDKMKVLIYDGWIGEKCDVSILEKTMKNRLGLEIRFKEKKINKTPISTLS